MNMRNSLSWTMSPDGGDSGDRVRRRGGDNTHQPRRKTVYCNQSQQQNVVYITLIAFEHLTDQTVQNDFRLLPYDVVPTKSRINDWLLLC
jgi:hypothetical protein